MKFFLKSLRYLLGAHLLGLFLLTLFRAEMFRSASHLLPPDVAGRTDWILTAFIRGIWFDNVIACYILIVPLVMIAIAGICHYWHRWIFKITNIWLGTLYCLAFMASAGNIPYYNYFSKPLNASIWNWAEYGTTTLGMMFGESNYWLYIAEFALATLVYALMLRFMRKHTIIAVCPDATTAKVHVTWKMRGGVALTATLLAGACLLGIRGRLGYNPIKVSAAYFCTNPTLNNLGVNPMFCLLTSTLDEMRPENRTLHLMPEADALKKVQQLYKRQGLPGISPIAHEVRPQGKATGQNVVVVLMESLSAKLMTRFGNKQQLTPYLDSLYRQSLSFSNCYSAGNHTNHGLYATLYSFPSIMYRNAMKGSNIPHYSGLPTVLRDNGYSTLFFMTHESQYDNMNAFLRTNGYDEIYAQENYPRNRIANHFGVPDDFLFEYALPVLRRTAARNKPFMATLLTISNHPPYVVPKAFADPHLKPEEQIVRYADHCIRQFMEAASKEPWFDNTLFVFLGDHGKLVGQADCELPESFNHIPLMFYGKNITAAERTDFAGQVDVAPTLLGMLNIAYTQNNFGLDLMREQRPAAFYTADKSIAARDSSHLFVYNAETQKEYCYLLKNGKPMSTPMAPPFAALKNYVYPLLQTAEYLVQHQMTLDHPHHK